MFKTKVIRSFCYQMWWPRPAIPALQRLRLEDTKYEINMGYTVKLYTYIICVCICKA